MTEEQRIIKAKISLLVNQPWFGQLSTYLNLFSRDSSLIETAAINERGDFFFNPEFIKKLKDDEIVGLVCHEILHLAFQHPFRVQGRDRILFNIAADLKVNAEISNNNSMKLPTGGLIPDWNHSWSLGKIKIDKIDEKTTEQIYEELYSKAPSFSISVQSGSGGVKVDTSQVPEPWKGLVDKMVKDLIKSEKDKLSDPSPSEAKQLARDWQERVDSANQTQRGSTPAGILRELAALENPEIPWFQVIRQRFMKLSKKKTWKKPNKKWLPYYFPGSEKNKSIKAVLAIDTSGSMGKDDITKAISEIWGIANTFRHFQLFIVFNDAAVWDVIEVSDGNKEKIRQLKPKGGGGTDFRPVFQLIKEKWENKIDCLVFFTDLWGDFPDKKDEPHFQTYWVTESRDEKVPFGQCIYLKHK